MDFTAWINKDLLPWVLPALIFFARILDVSIGTIRIVSVTRGMKVVASILGFIEVFFWLVIVSQVMTNLNNVANFFAYAGGYAMGNYVGVYLEAKLAIGTMMMRIVSKEASQELVKNLRDKNYGVTVVPAYGARGNVDILFTVVKRRELEKVMAIVKECNPNAFFSVEEVRAVHEGIFPGRPMPAQPSVPETLSIEPAMLPEPVVPTPVPGKQAA